MNPMLKQKHIRLNLENIRKTIKSKTKELNETDNPYIYKDLEITIIALKIKEKDLIKEKTYDKHMLLRFEEYLNNKNKLRKEIEWTIENIPLFSKQNKEMLEYTNEGIKWYKSVIRKINVLSSA